LNLLISKLEIGDFTFIAQGLQNFAMSTSITLENKCQEFCNEAEKSLAGKSTWKMDYFQQG
jgi:hypothetical protein